MNSSDLICPGSKDSQTAVAIGERYSLELIRGFSEDIPKVVDMMVSENCSGVVPIWNSHQGRVEVSDFLWEHLSDSSIYIYDIWPKKIEFWFLQKSDYDTSSNMIGSVVVAKTQCSKFLNENEFELSPFKLTTVAFEKYKEGLDLAGVLVAPDFDENDKEYIVLNKSTANQNNFTSFVTFIHKKNLDANLIKDRTHPLSAISMGYLGDGRFLKDDQREFFSNLFFSYDPADRKLDNIPKLIFVFDLDGKVSLLFEGEDIHDERDHIDDEIYDNDGLEPELSSMGNIEYFGEVGLLEEPYTEYLSRLIESDFPELSYFDPTDDFIFHRGENTVLFACPPLNMYTHGYTLEAVEPVVRIYIDSIFQHIDDGAECNDDELAFFMRHKGNWENHRLNFIDFKEI